MRKLRFWWLMMALLTFSATFVPSLFAKAYGQVCWAEPAIAQTAFSNICLNGQNLQISARQFYYRVEGVTAPQLIEQIQHYGPLWRDGNRYEAMHTWKMNRTFGVTQIGDRCILSEPQIKVETAITMPHWRPPINADLDLVNHWNSYTTALKSHEDGHEAIALEAGRKVLDILNTLPSYSSCEALRVAAKVAVAKVLERCSQKQVEYDRKTQHGLVQGASYTRWLTASSRL